ncbi:MAG: NADPH-dependent 7-cyano-7-deazaguanine reductase QueF [Zoogloeaceae bacterium]|nr:NADPH-dependent 7-cyano-7-deazaguanine reductase QueF [Zoogloeaceae bacterium]
MTNPPPTVDPRPLDDSLLGRPVSYQSTFSPQLLFPIRRQGKRDELGIAADALPFSGWDLWNAYELSWLSPQGKPVVALGQFRVPADSPHLIESKSLKLYLNSFNQTIFASRDAVAATVGADLTRAAGAPVAVRIFNLSEVQPARHGGGLPPGAILLDDLEVTISTYELDPSLLRTEGVQRDECLVSHLLKSNCLVTGQPDWGSVMIRYRGPAIDRAGLLAYLVSFREHNEFHEQCVERIFCDVWRRCHPEFLAVAACYTRRGGLDINPFRTSQGGWEPEDWRDPRQ